MTSRGDGTFTDPPAAGGPAGVSANDDCSVTDCTKAMVCAIKRSRSCFHFMPHLSFHSSKKPAINQARPGRNPHQTVLARDRRRSTYIRGPRRGGTIGPVHTIREVLLPQ